MQGIDEGVDIEESESEVFGQQIIGETTNRMRMEGMDRDRFLTCIVSDDDDDDDTDDTVDMEEIEGEKDEVFEDDDVETEEKLKGNKNDNREETGEKDPCGTCQKPVTWKSEGTQCMWCGVWWHLETRCSGLLTGRKTTRPKLEKYECNWCIRTKGNRKKGKVGRPRTKTCQKSSPEKEKCTAARKRYRNRCNKNEKWKKREEDSSPEKKRLKQDNDKDKKKEEEPKDQEQEKKDQDKINHEKRENVTRIKKCMDCSENYEAEKNNKEKLQCCFCEFSANGCSIFKQQKLQTLPPKNLLGQPEYGEV